MQGIYDIPISADGKIDILPFFIHAKELIVELYKTDDSKKFYILYILFRENPHIYVEYKIQSYSTKDEYIYARKSVILFSTFVDSTLPFDKIGVPGYISLLVNYITPDYDNVTREIDIPF